MQRILFSACGNGICKWALTKFFYSLKPIFIINIIIRSRLVFTCKMCGFICKFSLQYFGTFSTKTSFATNYWGKIVLWLFSFCFSLKLFFSSIRLQWWRHLWTTEKNPIFFYNPICDVIQSLLLTVNVLRSSTLCKCRLKQQKPEIILIVIKRKKNVKNFKKLSCLSLFFFS